jgi:UDP-glucose 4-epimerase
MVTGASGFIGSHVVDRLRERDIDVLAFDRLSSAPHRDDVYRFLGDVRDPVAVTEAVALSDGVIHLAAVLGTSETIDNPQPAVETNIHGSLNVFNACRQYNKRCSYVTVGNFWFANSYSITKTTAENLAWMYNKEHGTQIAVVRALNAYGIRQKAAPVRKIVPNLILPALRGEPITIYGDGEQIADMVPVELVAEVLVRALLVEHGQYIFRPSRETRDNPMKFEAGSGRYTSVNQIAQAVIDIVGQGEIRHVPMRGGEPEGEVVMGDPETLRPLYNGEVPEIETLESALARTVDYYRDTAGVYA